MKIFLTVGSMLPFDRLVRVVDDWKMTQPEHSIFAQIGKANYRPINFEYQSMISPSIFRARCSESDLIISHVGMGIIITALECGKPLIALPRKPELKEVTSNHQIATAKWLRSRPGIRIIDDENQIGALISETTNLLGEVQSISFQKHGELVQAVRTFILEGFRS
jgi:UDP-N-acetylglucosamine transferase subunit ALG13